MLHDINRIFFHSCAKYSYIGLQVILLSFFVDMEEIRNREEIGNSAAWPPDVGIRSPQRRSPSVCAGKVTVTERCVTYTPVRQVWSSRPEKWRIVQEVRESVAISCWRFRERQDIQERQRRLTFWRSHHRMGWCSCLPVIYVFLYGCHPSGLALCFECLGFVVVDDSSV